MGERGEKVGVASSSGFRGLPFGPENGFLHYQLRVGRYQAFRRDSV